MLRHETLLVRTAPRQAPRTAGHDGRRIGAPPVAHSSQPFSNASMPW